MLKLYIQDHSYAGATIVIAESEEQAREILAEKVKLDKWCYYEVGRPLDCYEVKAGYVTEVMGDR